MAESGTDGRTRRRWLRDCSAIAIPVLGGCVGRSNEEEDVIDVRFPYFPDQIQFNPWGPNYAWLANPLIFGYRSVSVPGGDPRLEHLITDISVDGRTARVEYADGYQWWNGEPVTARDDWVYHQLEAFFSDDRPIESVDLLDQDTLQYTFDAEYNERIVRDSVATGFVTTPAWLYEERLDRIKDTDTEAEREAEIDDFQSWRLPIDRVIEDGIGCGPYRLTRAVETGLTMDRFEDHPDADDLPLQRIMLAAAGGDRADQLITQGELDCGSGELDELGSVTPDQIQQLETFPTEGGMKLLVNWRNDHLAQRAVRRAILAALPLSDLAAGAGWGDPVGVQTGMYEPNDTRWLDGHLEQLTRYPVEADEETAISYLQADGFDRAGEQWVDENGQRLRLTLRTPTWDNWTTAADMITNALESLGIETRMMVQEPTTFRTRIRDGRYELALWWDDGDPLSAYAVDERNPSTLGYATDDPAADRSPLNKPVHPSIPTESSTASEDGGELTERNLVALWQELRGPVTAERERAIVRTFARWWNYDLPDLQLAGSKAAIWGNVRDFQWPSEKTSYRIMGAASEPHFHMLNAGSIKPVDD